MPPYLTDDGRNVLLSNFHIQVIKQTVLALQAKIFAIFKTFWNIFTRNRVQSIRPKPAVRRSLAGNSLILWLFELE